MSDQDKVIGVIGGMGPYAGLDLITKIFDNTEAHKDQEHLSVALLSYPKRVCDRSTFLFGKGDENPAYALAEIARQLEAAGAVVAGIPCNTAHAAPIFPTIVEALHASGGRIRLLHMIEETVRFLRDEIGGPGRIGLLSTLAVYRFRLYQEALEAAGFTAVLPDEDVQEHVVNRTIFDPDFGIKAQGNPVSSQARQNLLDAIEHLHRKGAEAVILGCTELPLAVPEPRVGSVAVLDPTLVLARALIRETYPEKLKPLPALQAAPGANGQEKTFLF